MTSVTRKPHATKHDIANHRVMMTLKVKLAVSRRLSASKTNTPDGSTVTSFVALQTVKMENPTFQSDDDLFERLP